MKTSSLFILTVLFIFAYSANVQAGTEFITCEASVGDPIDTDPSYTTCNIYDRQISYRSNHLAYKKQLLERQINYARPYIELREQYKINLEAMYDSYDTSME